jgi:hypothetical protein
MDFGDGVYVHVPDYLDDEAFPRLDVGSRFDWDVQLWDADPWATTDDRTTSARPDGTGAYERPATVLVGQARLHPSGWFLTAGRTWIDVLSPFDNGPEAGVVFHQPRPVEGQWVRVRGVLGFPPAYVEQEVFEPARRLAEIVDYPMPDDEWVVVEVTRPGWGGTVRLVKRR